MNALPHFAFLGIDPGRDIGFTEFVDGVFRAHVFHCPTDDDRNALYDVLDWYVTLYPTVVVACERYTQVSGGRHKTAQPDALEQIGAIKYVCRRLGIRLRLRGPADAFKIGGDAVQRRIGWFHPVDHARRATAQLLLAVAELRPDVYDDLLSRGTI